MTIWQNDSMATWHTGNMAQRQHGTKATWQKGNMEQRQHGSNNVDSEAIGSKAVRQHDFVI